MLTSVRAATVAALVVAALATYLAIALLDPSPKVLATPVAPMDTQKLHNGEFQTEGGYWWLGGDVPAYDEVVDVQLSASHHGATIQVDAPGKSRPESGDQVIVLAKRRATVRNLASADVNRVAVDFGSSPGLPDVEPSAVPVEFSLTLDSGDCRRLQPAQIWRVLAASGTSVDVEYERSLVLVGPCVA